MYSMYNKGNYSFHIFTTPVTRASLKAEHMISKDLSLLGVGFDGVFDLEDLKNQKKNHRELTHFTFLIRKLLY
jgi:hypothetical protein